MRQTIFTTLLVITILTISYFIFIQTDAYFKKQEPKDGNNLRTEILNNIYNPFKHSDTLILETIWGVCGNSKPSELPIVFDTKLTEPSFMKKLSLQNKISVITMGDFNNVMDTILKYRFHGKYPENLWDICRLNKVHAEIHAEKLSSKKVRTYENYLYNNINKFIQKDFIYKNNKWTFRITDSLTRKI